MSVTLMVITDGRVDCLRRTVASFDEQIDQDLIDHRIVVNDCPADPDFAAVRWTWPP